MNIKKYGVILASTLILSTTIVGCNKDTTTTQTEENANEMNYIEKEELKDNIDSDEYVILDVRKAEDYQKEHIDGAYLADQDAANKGGDDEAGIENLKNALKEATGNETGNDNEKYALVCYSGKSYAQKATDLMIEMGIPKDKIYTLKGGMEDWEKGGDEYNSLLNK